MKGDRGIDKQRHKCYRDNILIPFIKESWIVFGGCNKSPVLESMKAVSWQDGDLTQRENIVSEESFKLYKENNICANKQNAACSAVE